MRTIHDDLTELLERIRAASGGSDDDSEAFPTSSADPEVGHCPQHGAYPIAVRDARGVLRYRPSVCPVCMAERVSRRLMEGAAIPLRHQHCRFDSYVVQNADQSAVLEACRKYAENFGSEARKTGASLILSGRVGTGKNHLAVAIARTVLEQGFTVVQATAHEVIVRIREAWGRQSTVSEREVVRTFVQPDLLILDEVGKQFGGKGEEVHLFEVINQRYLERKPMLVLSNEDKDGIEDYLGEAAFDRLCEGGQLLRLNWQGYRRGQGRQG